MNYIKRLNKITAEAYLLPTDLVMVDCEMTGVIPERDNLLQIACLKLKLKDNQYEIQGEPLVKYLKYDGQPSNDFHKKFLTHIFKECNKSKLEPKDFKKELEDWLGDLKGKAQPTGDCVPTDMAFLFAKGCAERGDVGDAGQVPGTFHYEYFEMNPIKQLARVKAGTKDIEIEGYNHEGIHDALVDCQNQLLELNKFIGILLDV